MSDRVSNGFAFVENDATGDPTGLRRASDGRVFPLATLDSTGALTAGGFPLRIGGSDNFSGAAFDTFGRAIGFTIDEETYAIDWDAGLVTTSTGRRWTFVIDPLGRFAAFSA